MATAPFLPRRLTVRAALVLLWLVASVAAWNLPLNNDVSWQLWVARQLRGGAVFGRDIAESNPPLWFWAAMPLSWLGERIGVDAGHLLSVAVVTLSAATLGLCDSVLPVARRGWALAGLALVLFVLPLFEWGERDHLMAVATLPYVLLAARRATGAPVALGLALAIGVLAGAGVALKPHFLLLPVAIEAWLLRQAPFVPGVATHGRAFLHSPAMAEPRQAEGEQGERRRLRPESVAIIAILVAYALAVALFAPAYLTSELPQVAVAYGAFKPPFITLWTHQIYLPTWLLAGAALALGWRGTSPAVKALGIAAAAFVVIYAAQGKGFPYHALPVTMASAAAAWLLLGEAPQRIARGLAVAAAGWALLCAVMIGVFVPARLGAITDRLEALPPGSTVAVISAHSWDAFPLVENRRLVWPMRGLLLWQFPAIARDAGSALAAQTRADIVHDLWCHPPRAILFDDPARSPAMPRGGFDYRRFVLADPAAATLLSNYRLARRRGGATLWETTRPPEPRGTDCRPISSRPDLP